MMRSSWLLFTTVLLSTACAQPNNEPSPLVCDPGTHIFCRCADGGPSTRECREDGRGFYDCESCDSSSHWDDEPNPHGDPPGNGAPGFGGSESNGNGSGGAGNGPAGSGAAGSGGAGSGGAGSGASDPSSGSGANGTVANQPLFGICASDSECGSGMCRSGYCTQACTLVSDCPYPTSECVPLDATTAVCMASCNTAVDCNKVGGNAQCGFTHAIDNWDVKTCSVWANGHQLVPNQRDCVPFDHDACHLGYAGREKVCSAEGQCATGCYAPKDCPQGKTCSSDGTTLGACQ